MSNNKTKNETSPPADTTEQDKKEKSNDNTAIESSANNNASPVTDIESLLKNIFTGSNIMLIIWFLAIYFITYIIMGIFSNDITGHTLTIKIIDIAILFLILMYSVISYYNIPESERSKEMNNIGKYTYDTLNDPYTLLYSALFLIFYNIITFVFFIPTSGLNMVISLWLMSTLAWTTLTITAIVLFFKEVFGISILDSTIFDKLWKNKNSSTEKKSDKPVVSSDKNEVFNVSNNLYTYDDARAVCTAYGARLATYDEVEDAYNGGAEWCNYGWSENQMAFFPTQKTTWDELQKNPKHKNNCGRPGINGGYFDNPYIKFGVNCFGKKPKPSDRDLLEMEANKNIVFPKTEDELLMDKKVQFWKENADKLLHINSFNKKQWSEY